MPGAFGKCLITTDAYHSLSIEQYKVTPDLIERVKSGNWAAKKIMKTNNKEMPWLQEAIGRQRRRLEKV